MRYTITKIRNGLWEYENEKGVKTQHSTQYGAEKMAMSQEHTVEEFDRAFPLTELVNGSDATGVDQDTMELRDKLVSFLTSLHHSHTEEVEQARRSKDDAYKERDMLVCALSKVFPSYLARHDEADTEWENDWRWIVYIEIPTKIKVVFGDQHNHTPESKWFENNVEQVSWHIHDSERQMFNHLEVKENNWDGHTTEQKYQRLEALTPNTIAEKGCELCKDKGVIELIEDERKRVGEELLRKIEKVKKEVEKQTGSFKYSDQYEDCIKIITNVTGAK